jgi:hypothetical protein
MKDWLKPASAPMTCSAAAAIEPLNARQSPRKKLFNVRLVACRIPRSAAAQAEREAFNRIGKEPRAVSKRQVFANGSNFNASSRTPGMSRREHNKTGIQLLRMEAALFAVGSSPLLGSPAKIALKLRFITRF